MISHRIVVHKPVYTPPAIYRPPTARDPYKTQEEFDAYMENFKYNDGDFVTLTQVRISDVNQLHSITRIERDFSKLVYSPHTGIVQPMHVVSCNLTIGVPWCRWDNPHGYRFISQEEFDTIVIPNRDKLQDHCTKWG